MTARGSSARSSVQRRPSRVILPPRAASRVEAHRFLLPQNFCYLNISRILEQTQYARRLSDAVSLRVAVECERGSGLVEAGKAVGVSSTIETLERELGEAQLVRAKQQKAVIRAENAHDAACAARDEAWAESEGFGTDTEVEWLTTMVYERRRELYEAIDRLKAAEGKERRIKSRLMYVLPAERRRYLSGTVDEEFEDLLVAVREAYRRSVADVVVCGVTERPGELDLRGDATWRALERLYSGTVRRWVEIRSLSGCGLATPPRRGGARPRAPPPAATLTRTPSGASPSAPRRWFR